MESDSRRRELAGEGGIGEDPLVSWDQTQDKGRSGEPTETAAGAGPGGRWVDKGARPTQGCRRLRQMPGALPAQR